MTPLATILQAMPPGAAARKCMRLPQLKQATRLPAAMLKENLETLVRWRIAVQLSRGCYRLTERGQKIRDTGRAPAPLPPPGVTGHVGSSMQSRIWRTLRRLRKASVQELLVYAAGPMDGTPTLTARLYLNRLARAGVVAVLPGRPARYLLVRDLGPLAPRATRRGRQPYLWDLNSDALYDIAAAGKTRP